MIEPEYVYPDLPQALVEPLNCPLVEPQTVADAAEMIGVAISCLVKGEADRKALREIEAGWGS